MEYRSQLQWQPPEGLDTHAAKSYADTPAHVFENIPHMLA